MADKTKIEWADSTLNFWIGCTQVSPACDHCYAMSMARRLKIKWNAPPVRTSDRQWTRVETYQRGAKRFAKKHGRPRRVFVNSMSDFFDKRADPRWRLAACRKMEHAWDVDWLLVTKRPQNVLKMVPKNWLLPGGWPENVWLGVTVENQEEADRRIPLLMAVPGVRVRFLSMEPLLGEVNITRIDVPATGPGTSTPAAPPSWTRYEPLSGFRGTVDHKGYCTGTVDRGARISWVITGGESGQGARAPHPRWVRSIRDQCLAAGVAFFFKQWGAWAPNDNFVEDHPPMPAPGRKVLVGECFGETNEPIMWLVGKKEAGRELDGALWTEFPEETRLAA